LCLCLLAILSWDRHHHRLLLEPRELAWQVAEQQPLAWVLRPARLGQAWTQPQPRLPSSFAF
jgi:hypothetical protein